MNREPDNAAAGQPDPAARDGINRREFLIRAGATGALLAGAAAGGYALWQPKHFVPGFQPEKGLQLPSYASARTSFCPRSPSRMARTMIKPSAPPSARSAAWTGS